MALPFFYDPIWTLYFTLLHQSSGLMVADVFHMELVLAIKIGMKKAPWIFQDASPKITLLFFRFFQTVDGHFNIKCVIPIVHGVDGLCVYLLVNYFA